MARVLIVFFAIDVGNGGRSQDLWLVVHARKSTRRNSRSWPNGHHAKSEDGRSATILSQNREVPLLVGNSFPTVGVRGEGATRSCNMFRAVSR